MSARSRTVSVGRHVGGAAIEALLVASIVAVVALALTGVYGPARFVTGSGAVDAAPRTGITLSLLGGSGSARVVVSGDASFALTRSVADDEVLWVTQNCFDADGAVVSRLDMVVIWGTWDSLDGTAGPAPTAGATCKAYATWKPWLDRAIRGTVVEFSVAPS